MLCADIATLFSLLPGGGRVLGIDFGERKMGLALSDATRLIASPFAVYERRNMRQDLGELNSILKAKDIRAVVMGLPLQSDGLEGDMCPKVRSFADKLIRKSGVCVYLHDERYTTAMASRATMTAGLRRKASQQIDDKVSAALILQQVLDMANEMGINAAAGP
ncbi:Holliday junction resolvase RuvX [Candidatus Anaplasma sp. TIGMIC]|uniref:Holliday junction resolvase RuvX n=1 Tax=Candidatus Anaplasma sp. TIGMIC TaxID=3020713 RepID=UPI00232A9403|nr:Holliday junction resolvase RuvX [Candidatus Anaplasma sp. TIGMIC]MDB1135215.1 Holliday junction resolvase RuvX [Candidatus Anaplasma sp. TIGMIC]